jgi:hypothetical protein
LARLRRGGTDTDPAGFDASFMREQQPARPRAPLAAWRSGKQVIATHYGAASRSTSPVFHGRPQAMLMAQRYPYFDGIVAGAPAMRFSGIEGSGWPCRWGGAQGCGGEGADASGAERHEQEA